LKTLFERQMERHREVAFFALGKERRMHLNWNELVSRTDLKNKNCVVRALNNAKVVSVGSLDNLPGNYGRPWLCENPVTVVVIKLRAAISEAAEEVPTIDEVIEVVPEPEEPEQARISASTPVVELEIEGVTQGQLQAIAGSGIGTVEELFDKTDELEGVSGIGEATKLRILAALTEALENQ
jgi:hypothetical protein